MAVATIAAALGRRPLLNGALALFALLAVLYSFSMTIRSSRFANITGDEPFYLLTAQSLVEDGDLDLNNQYARKSYEVFFDYPRELWRQSVPAADGRLLSPHDIGLPVLLAPGFAVDGLRGAKVTLVGVAAATFSLAYVLVARATGAPLLSWLATLAVGVSPTAFVYSSAIYPELPAALMVVAGLLAVHGGKPGWARSLAVAGLCSGLPWLGGKYIPLAAVLGVYLLLRATPAGRLAFLGVAGIAASGYMGFNYAVFGGLTPYNVNVIYAGDSPGELISAHVEVTDRVYRLWGIFIDQRFGLARWAPVLLPVVPALVLLIRKGLPAVVLCLVWAQLMVAVFVAITMMGWWFPGRTMAAVLPLLALPLALLLARSGPRARTLIAALGAYTFANTVVLALAGHGGEITTAVNPFEMEAPLFRWATPLFPNYTAWTWHTWTATSGWLLLWAWGGALFVRRRVRQGVTLNAEYIPSR